MRLDSIDIKNYRGIKDCKIENLEKINIIVGDNNSGKTSILEVINFLRIPQDINYIKSIAGTRSILMPNYNHKVAYNDLINIFPRDVENKEISINYNFDNGSFINYKIQGEEEKIEIQDELQTQGKFIKTKAFTGKIIIDSDFNKLNIFNGESKFYTIKHNFERISFDKEIINSNFVSTYDHLTQSLIANIIKDDKYKKRVIEKLNNFNEDIIDLRKIPDDTLNDDIECIENRNGEYIPINTYGDGIRKMLGIANRLVDAENGILLIDEIETSLHYSIMKDVFDFVIELCSELNIQLFITTHNSEVIDKILNVYSDENEEYLEQMSVITLVAKNNQTVSRTLKGYEAKKTREEFGLELR